MASGSESQVITPIIEDTDDGDDHWELPQTFYHPTESSFDLR